MSITTWVIGIVIALIFLFVIYTYNSLIRLNVRVSNSWSQINVQLKRRYDLIPNLVESVKGYMKHEKKLLEEITKQRSALISGTTKEKAKASNIISEALKTIFAVAENYPKLMANKSFINLQNRLSETEDKIAYSRQFYNDTVMRFNEAIKVFPQNIFARMFGFTEKEYFKAGSKEKESVKVKF